MGPPTAPPSLAGDRQPWRFFGIPLRIDPSWFIVVGLVSWSLARGYFPEAAPTLPHAVYWLMGIAGALLLFVCVLLHELGHALTARAFGIPVPGMTLFIFGGVAHIAREATRPSVELRVAIAGPLVSVAIAAACRLGAGLVPAAMPLASVAVALLRYLAMINTGLLLFNLLPGFPLDGGRVLRAALWAMTGRWETATRIASVCGMAVGIGLMLLGVWAATQGGWSAGVWYLLLGLFLRNAARVGWLQAKQAAAYGV